MGADLTDIDLGAVVSSQPKPATKRKRHCFQSTPFPAPCHCRPSQTLLHQPCRAFPLIPCTRPRSARCQTRYVHGKAPAPKVPDPPPGKAPPAIVTDPVPGKAPTPKVPDPPPGKVPGATPNPAKIRPGAAPREETPRPLPKTATFNARCSRILEKAGSGEPLSAAEQQEMVSKCQ